MEQLAHVHFMLFAVYQKLKTLVLQTNMPGYAIAWKIFLEIAIKIPSNRECEVKTFRKHHHFAFSYRAQWNNRRWLTNGCYAFMCDEYHFRYCLYIELYRAESQISSSQWRWVYKRLSFDDTNQQVSLINLDRQFVCTLIYSAHGVYEYASAD